MICHSGFYLVLRLRIDFILYTSLSFCIEAISLLQNFIRVFSENLPDIGINHTIGVALIDETLYNCSSSEVRPMKNNKIYIIGSGAIGKALAVFLQHEEKDVTLVRGRVDNLPDEEFLITVTNQDHQKFQQKITTPTYSNLIDINGVVLIATKTWQ